MIKAELPFVLDVGEQGRHAYMSPGSRAAKLEVRDPPPPMATNGGWQPPLQW